MKRIGLPSSGTAFAAFALSLLSPAGAFAASEGAHGVSPFVFEFSIFVLAIFVGYYVVWSVTPALHTPLMSVTNAISSVIAVGALLAVAAGGRGRLERQRQHDCQGFRLSRPRDGLREHLRRLPGHEPHARDVQEERKEGGALMSPNAAALLYLVAGVLFILALRGLSSPETSRQGNRSGMIGMAIAIVDDARPPVPRGLELGAHHCRHRHRRHHRRAMARRIAMTAMPQLVALFHALVGLAAVLVAAARAECAASFLARDRPIHGQKPDRDVARRCHRRDDLLGFGHRLRQARRAHVRQADPSAAPPSHQYRPSAVLLFC